jgi:histone acetyltransferase (RNA polymerase elongator complex component)
MAVPIYPELTNEMLDYVIEKIEIGIKGIADDV